MNKEQFIFSLRRELQNIDPSLLKEILADFEEHFASGLARGKNESAIAAELGDPAEIAAQYIDTISEGQSHHMVRASWQYQDPAGAANTGNPPRSQDFQTTRDAPDTNKKINEAMLILVIVFNLFIGIPIWIGLFSILLGLWTTAGGIGVAACVLFVIAVLEAGITSVILALFAVSLTALTVLGVIIMYYLSKLLIMLLAKYISYNRKLVLGGA